MTPRKKIGIGMAEVEAAVAARFGLTRDQIRGLDRQRAVARPRQIAMFLARELTGQSLPRIGMHFARDHTTVLYATRRIARLIAADACVAGAVAGCRELLARKNNLPPSVSHAGKLASRHLPPPMALPCGGRKPVIGS